MRESNVEVSSCAFGGPGSGTNDFNGSMGRSKNLTKATQGSIDAVAWALLELMHKAESNGHE